uniref:Kunitz-type protease inhibitor 1-like n=1 Tax=Scophthalmus maximus TaxID=52904 RepID=A0A8D3DZQ3_SCOMX
MPSSSSSSSSFLGPLVLSLLLLLPLLRRGGAAPDADCSDPFRSGQDDFVLDAEDAAKEGAALLATAHVQSPEACERACCLNPHCNLALLAPRGTAGAAAAHNRTCALFSCVHRNRFVCRFVNQVGCFYCDGLTAGVGQRLHSNMKITVSSGEPIANAGGDVIVQPGETVTLDGIESLALGDAHIRDWRWRVQSGEAGVKMEDTDLPDQMRLSNLQPGEYVFQLTVTDSNGQSDDAEVTVHVLSPERSSCELFCLAPVKVGPCRAAFPRWRYDAVTGGCEQFVFGGCKQNNNNYLNKDECLLACRGVTERRHSSLDRSVCGSECRSDQLSCSSSCCVDRSLECDGVKHCSDASDEEHCSKPSTSTRGKVCFFSLYLQRVIKANMLHANNLPSPARCAEPPHTGPCRASHTRWYYDPLDRKCHRFTYGGCQGNDNNFEEENMCDDTCDGVTGTIPLMSLSSSGSIALAVILSVAILALLAILTYCFLKKRRECSHRPVATGPAHVALSEQDTLVYNTTTKPV